MHSTRVAHLPFSPTITQFFFLPSIPLPFYESRSTIYDPVTLGIDDHELGREPGPTRRARYAPY